MQQRKRYPSTYVGRTPRANGKLKVIEGERQCEIYGCRTKLSRYNVTARCWPHRERKAPRLRGATEEQRLAKIPGCDTCEGLAMQHDYGLRPVEIEGMLHLEGLAGAGALCEGFLE